MVTNLLCCNKGKGKGFLSPNIYRYAIFIAFYLYPSYFSAATVDPTLDLCTRYPLLLGGHRQIRFKACPRLLHMTSAAWNEPQTPRSWVQCLTRSATSTTYNIYTLSWKQTICTLYDFCTYADRTILSIHTINTTLGQAHITIYAMFNPFHLAQRYFNTKQ